MWRNSERSRSLHSCLRLGDLSVAGEAWPQHPSVMCCGAATVAEMSDVGVQMGMPHGLTSLPAKSYLMGMVFPTFTFVCLGLLSTCWILSAKDHNTPIRTKIIMDQGCEKYII